MLLNLKTKTSCDPDDIPNSFLRRYAESLGKFLVVLFSASLMSSVLPDDWRAARTVAIFKKGDRSLPQNYRPISLISSCCKLIEHIIANHILVYLEERSILTPWQHGFRKGYSTVTQLVPIVHSFASVIDNNGQVDTIFLDFRKAFDKVPHDKLILKLRSIGLPDMIISWITAYLNNRVQRVTVGGQQSRCLPVTSGIPQGSVLGPLLFLLYINHIVSVVLPGVSIWLFADDCVLFKCISSSDDQGDLQASLNNVSEWCREWGMLLNNDKSVLLRITRKKTPIPFTYTLKSSLLTQVTKHRRNTYRQSILEFPYWQCLLFCSAQATFLEARTP